jgi:photosystem II stability/assembly factor-like uncharacterized protein
MAASTPTGENRPISGALVQSIAVSPLYSTTGVVVVAGVALNCQRDCQRLWRSPDGGVTWQRARAAGWNGGPVAVAAIDGQHQRLFTETQAGLMSSDDLGDTWSTFGPTGFADVSPDYPTTHRVAIAGQHDYLLDSSGPHPVSGSSGVGDDIAFMLSPGLRGQRGDHPPALLAANVKSTSTVEVLTCDGSLTCAEPGAPLAVVKDSFGLAIQFVPSPRFQDDGVVFAVSSEGVEKSSDGGRSFTPLGIGDPHATTTGVGAMALAPDFTASAHPTAYVALLQTVVTPGAPNPDSSSARQEGGIYVTRDGGGSWAALGSSIKLSQGATAVAVAPDGRIFAGYLASPTDGGLLCSASGGQGWGTACPAAAGAQKAIGSGGAGSTGACAASKACGAGASTTIPVAPAHGTSSGTLAAQAAAPAARAATSVRPAGGDLRFAVALGGLIVIIAAGGGLLYRRLRPS